MSECRSDLGSRLLIVQYVHALSRGVPGQLHLSITQVYVQGPKESSYGSRGVGFSLDHCPPV